MENPFTLTFGKEPLLTIKRNDVLNKINEDFSLNNPSSQSYIFIGARGAGKTVLLSEEYNYFNSINDWVAVDVNPHRNIQEDLASAIYEKGKLRKLFIKKEFDFSFHGATLHLEGNNPISSVSSVLDIMFEYLKRKNVKVLITLDEVTSNPFIKEFVHDFQSYIRKGYKIFLLMSGLYENIVSLQNDKSLTFLFRTPKILLKPLDLFSIKNSYKTNLNISDEKAKELAKLTNGYGFAYQLVGHLFFQRKATDEKFYEIYDEQLKINSYDKIWSTISEKERILVMSLIESEEKKTSEILSNTNFTMKEYSVYRDRLMQKGVIISPRNGFLSIALPRFKEFIYNNI